MFKVGDKVKCVDTNTIDGINDAHSRLTLHKVYTIEKEADEDTVVVKDDTGKVHSGFFASRFELVKEEEEFKAGDVIVCVVDDGYTEQITAGKHYTIESIEDNFLKITNDRFQEEAGYCAYRFKKASPSTFKVRCIENSHFVDKLITIGKEYEVISEDKFFYKIVSNTGAINRFLKCRFEKVTSDPIPTTLNSILPDPESEYVILDMEKYGHLMGRVGIDEYKMAGGVKKWQIIRDIQWKSMKSYAESYSKCKWRCKKEHLPILKESVTPTKVEDPNEIVEITDKNHIGRACDFLKLRSDNTWHPLQISIGKILDSPICYMYGCKRKDLPTQETKNVTIKEVKPIDYNRYHVGNMFIGSNNMVNPSVRPILKKEEEEMKKETAIAAGKTVGKFAARWSFAALNYWVFEPAAGIGRPIMKSVRYATFLGGLAACSYGYYHPDVVMDGIKSCLPKISIEAPSILQGDEKVEKT